MAENSHFGNMPLGEQIPLLSPTLNPLIIVFQLSQMFSKQIDFKLWTNMIFSWPSEISVYRKVHYKLCV